MRYKVREWSTTKSSLWRHKKGINWDILGRVVFRDENFQCRSQRIGRACSTAKKTTTTATTKGAPRWFHICCNDQRPILGSPREDPPPNSFLGPVSTERKESKAKPADKQEIRSCGKTITIFTRFEINSTHLTISPVSVSKNWATKFFLYQEDIKNYYEKWTFFKRSSHRKSRPWRPRERRNVKFG